MENKRLSVKKNMLFNSAGSIVYLGFQWLLTVLAVRLGNYGDNGMLSLSIYITGFFSVFCTFGIRVFQVSDTVGRYSATNYISTRLLTSCFGAAACVAFVLINAQYDPAQRWCILGYMLFRTTEAIADVMAGEEQKAWRMDYVGISFLIRGVVMLAAFTVVMSVWHDMPLALLTMSAATLVVVILFDGLIVHRLTGFTVKLSLRDSMPLLREAWPLMINSALLMFMAAVPKYLLEMYAGKDIMGIYSAVATPAMIVQAGCSFIYTPLVSPLSEAWQQGDMRRFRKLLLGAAGVILGLLTAVILGAAWLGDWALQLLFTDSIAPYTWLLIPVLLTSFCSALIYFLEIPLTVARRLKVMTLIHTIAGAATLALSLWLVPLMGMQGVNLVIYLCSGGDALAMGIVALSCGRKS